MKQHFLKQLRFSVDTLNADFS